MARPPSTQPTDRELQILQVLWENGPSTLNQVCTALERGQPQKDREDRSASAKRVPTTTIATMLKVMLEKGLVQRKSGERGYRWSAQISRRAASSTMVQRLVERVFDGSAQRLVAHVIEAGKLSDKEVDELRKLLDEHGPSKTGRKKK